MCFNRTFMELKFQQTRQERQKEPCFNRTFMELKFDYAYTYNESGRVLIVPLWN